MNNETLLTVAAINSLTVSSPKKPEIDLIEIENLFVNQYYEALKKSTEQLGHLKICLDATLDSKKKALLLGESAVHTGAKIGMASSLSIGGAVIGTAIFPGAGTLVGAVGGAAGGLIGGVATSAIMAKVGIPLRRLQTRKIAIELEKLNYFHRKLKQIFNSSDLCKIALTAGIGKTISTCTGKSLPISALYEFFISVYEFTHGLTLEKRIKVANILKLVDSEIKKCHNDTVNILTQRLVPRFNFKSHFYIKKHVNIQKLHLMMFNLEKEIVAIRKMLNDPNMYAKFDRESLININKYNEITSSQAA